MRAVLPAYEYYDVQGVENEYLRVTFSREGLVIWYETDNVTNYSTVLSPGHQPILVTSPSPSR